MGRKLNHLQFIGQLREHIQVYGFWFVSHIQKDNDRFMAIKLPAISEQ
jgi:hypothetical protein